MKAVISTQLTSDNIRRILALLAETPPQLAAILAPTPPENLRVPLAEGERSPAEILAHMVNSEERLSESIYLALLLDQPVLPNIHPERDWGKLLRHDLLDSVDLLTYIRIRRAILVNVLTGLTATQWAREIQEEGKQRKETVYWRARTLVMHELDHINELQAKLHSDLQPPREGLPIR